MRELCVPDEEKRVAAQVKVHDGLKGELARVVEEGGQEISCNNIKHIIMTTSMYVLYEYRVRCNEESSNVTIDITFDLGI